MAARGSRRAFSLAKSLGLGLGLTAAILPKHSALADSTWTGTTNQDWNTAGNWNNGIPGAGATGVAFINTATGNFPIFSAIDGTLQTANDIEIGNGVAGRLDQTGGSLSTGNGNWLIVGANTGSNGIFNISGGTLSAGAVHLARGTGTENGTINVSGTGTINSAGDFVVGDFGNNTTTGTGTLNVSGGIVNVVGNLLVSYAGSSTSLGQVNLTGGVINVGTGSQQNVVLNTYDTTQGQLIVNGGTLNLKNNSNILFSNSNNGSGTGTSFVTLSSGAITGGASSVMNLMTANVAGNNTVNLNGGTLTIGSIISSNATGTRAFNFGGGTLKAAAASTTFFAAGVASAATVNSGGGAIDNAGFGITIGQVFGGTGGLTFADTGAAATTTMSGLSTYTGTLTVNSGTLAVGSGIAGTTAASIPSNLGDIGTSVNRSIVINNGGTLSLTTGNVLGYDSAKLAGLTLQVNQGGVFQTGLNGTGGGYFNKIGAVNLNGGTINVGNGDAGYASALALLGTVTVGGTSTTASTIGVLSGALTATQAKVTLGQSNAGISSVTFNVGDVTGDSQTDLTVAAVLANQANGATTASSLVKSGAGTMLLTGANVYTGTTTISAGTLQVGNGNAASLGGGAYAAAISNAGTLVFNSMATQSLTGGVTGGGAFTQAGTGVLSLSNTNALGALTVSGGTLNVVGPTTAGATSVTGATVGVTETAPATSTLSLGANSLTFGTSNLALSFNGLANPSAGLVSTTGALTLNGTVTVSLASFGGLTSTANNATLPLLTYGSQGGAGTFTLATTSSGHTNFALNDTATALYLSVSAITNTWTGATNNTWDINTTLNWSAPDQKYLEGDIVLFNDTGSNTNPINLAANVNPASVTFNNSTKTYTISSTGGFGIAGSATLVKNGTGLVSLSTNNTYTGGTTINAGTLAINSATSLGAASGALTLNAGTLEATANITTARNITLGNAASAISVDTGAAYTVSGVLSGGGTLNVTGAGTLALSGTNTYTGGTNINAGVLSFGADANLGASSSGVTLNGGTLTTTAGLTDTHAITVGATGGTINVSATGQLFMNTANTLLGSGALTVTGSSGTLAGQLAGAGNLRLGQTNTYSGNVTIQSGGNFEYGVAGAVGTGATFTLGNEGELPLQGSAATTLPNVVTVSGGTNSVLSFENGNAGVFGGNIAANANLTVGLRDWYNNATVHNGTISGVISGAGGLTVNSGTGSGGLLTLSGANTYMGGTTLSASQALAGTSTAFGTGAITVGGTAAQVQLASGVNVANALTINGGGVAVQGIVYVPTANANATYSGPINITAAGAAGGDFAANGGTLTLTGPITSTVPVTTRIGTVIFSSTASSYTQLNVQAGTGQLGANNAIPTGASVGLGASGAATLDLAGFNQTLAGLTQTANTGTVTNSGVTASTLTTTGTSTFAGVIQDGTSANTLVVSSGALSLTGLNTFTGNVTVNGGTLNAGLGLGDPGAAATQGSALGNIGTAVARTLTVNNGGTLALTAGNTLGTGGSANTLSAVTLTVNQGGAFQTGSQTGTGGFWNKIGAVNLNGGAIQVGTGANNTNFQALALIGTVTVGGSAASTISNFAGSTAGSSGIHLGQNAVAGQSITFNVGTTGAAGADLTISAPLLDTSASLVSSGLTKTGTGTLALTAANTYTGPTAVTAGTLLISSGSIASASASVTSGGALTLGNNTALADVLSLSLVSGAALNLNASNGTSEIIGALSLDGNAVSPGTYTAQQLTGMDASIIFTSGLGETLTVAVPEPSTWVAGALTVGLVAAQLRRRRLRSWLRLARKAA